MEIHELLTKHGKRRMEERVDPKNYGKTPEQQAELALRLGLRRKDLHGLLYRWVEKKCYKYPNKLIRIHRGCLYIFSVDQPHQLVTVFPVPKEMRNQTKRLERKKRKRGE